MIILETHQIKDQLGFSNLYVLEIAENYVLLPWNHDHLHLLFCMDAAQDSPSSFIHASPVYFQVGGEEYGLTL